MKKCTKCLELKDFSSFASNNYTIDKLQYTCKNCQRTYKQSTQPRVKEIRKLYYVENCEEIKQESADYRKNNPEKVKQTSKNTRDKSLPRRLAANAKRRADKIQATPPWITKEQLQEIKKIYETCPKGYHVDHIIPLKGKNVCGLHVAWNLQHLPAKENLQKNNKVIEEYSLKLTPTEEPEDT